MQDKGKFWDDPESPWSVGMRRHTRKFKWMLAGFAILETFIGITFFLLSMMGDRKFFSSSNSILLIIIVSGSMVFPLIMIYRKLTLHRKLVHLIPKTKGRLCPICHIAMSSVETNKLNCSRCMRGETIEAIESFWEQYALDATALTGSFLKYKSQGKSGLGRFRAELQRRMIESPGFAAGYMISIFLIGGVVFGLFRSQSLLSSIFEYAHMMLIMGGFGFLGIGYAKRKGMTLHCVACEYQQAPTGKKSERCPECGANWRVEGAIVKGHRIRTHRHYAIGLALIIAGFLLIFSPFTTSWKYKVLPTNSLIHDAVSGRHVGDVWPELLSRSLSKSQLDTLINGLIDQLIRKRFMSPDGSAWLFSTAVFTPEQKNRLTDALIEKHARFDLIDPTASAWLFTTATFTREQADRLTEILFGRQCNAERVHTAEDVWVYQMTALTPQQELQLAKCLLDRRLRFGDMSSLGGGWLYSKMTAGSIPEDLVERFYSEELDVELTSPAQAKVGEDVVVEMRTVNRNSFAAGVPDCHVYLGDYAVNGRVIPDSRAKNSWAVAMLATNGKKFGITLTPELPGTTRITREIWVVFYTQIQYGPIVWEADGSPNLPGAPIVWSRKITLRHDIEVID
ncbi:MAG: hypothetical protein IIB54_10120 [Planctomycetes bacterium]|nr:hypothetical protein [Planctomycetota bacterium]